VKSVLFSLVLIVSTPFWGGSSPGYGISGNWKTPESVLRRILDGSPSVALPAAVRRLDETGVFFPVLHTNAGGGPVLVIRDKWTAVPVVTFKRGGEATVVRLGAADDNFVGSMAAVVFYADFLSGYGGQADARSVSFSLFVRW
jgi:hypothetical protein